MSELRRKYDGLKQAHKELSVEVVGLRARIGELEEQAHTDANVAQQMVAKYKGRSDRYLKALKWLEKQFNRRSKKVVFNKECYEVITTALAKEAGDTVAECGTCDNKRIIQQCHVCHTPYSVKCDYLCECGKVDWVDVPCPDCKPKCGKCGDTGIDSEGYSPGHVEMLPCDCQKEEVKENQYTSIVWDGEKVR